MNRAIFTDAYIEQDTLRHEGRKIPYIAYRGARSPGVFLASGFGADHNSPRAKHLLKRTGQAQHNFVAFSYSGLEGKSSNPADVKKLVTDWSFSTWLNDAEAVFDKKTVGTQVMVGSSFGASSALKVAEKFPNRVSAVVLIAPAMEVEQQLIAPAMAYPPFKQSYDNQGYFDAPIPGGDSSGAGKAVRVTKEKVAEGVDILKQMRDAGVKLACPVLVIAGGDDPVVTEDAASRVLDMIDAPKKHLTVVSRIGHVTAGEPNYDAMWRVVRRHVLDLKLA